jgi:hypothetical protein
VADAKIVDQKKKDITKCSKKYEKSICKIAHNILMQEKNHAHCKKQLSLETKVCTMQVEKWKMHHITFHDSATQKLAQKSP